MTKKNPARTARKPPSKDMNHRIMSRTKGGITVTKTTDPASPVLFHQT